MKPRLIIMEFHHLGDALLSFPFIRAASEKYEVWVYCRPQLRSVFLSMVPATRIVTWEPFWTRGCFWSLAELANEEKRLKEINAEIVVCGWADSRVHLFMLLTGASRRVGFPMNRLNYFSWKAAFQKSRLFLGICFSLVVRLWKGQPLLTCSLQRVEFNQSHWKDWIQVGEALGLTVSMETPWFKLESGGNTSVPNNNGRWLVHVGARLAEKCWALKNFEQVANTYLDKSHREWVCLGLSERRENYPINLRSKYKETTTWNRLIEEVNAADLILCHDTSVAHLAAALGKRVVTLFGGMPTCWFAPYGNEQWVIAYGDMTEFKFGEDSSLVAKIKVRDTVEMMKYAEADFNTWQKKNL